MILSHEKDRLLWIPEYKEFRTVRILDEGNKRNKTCLVLMLNGPSSLCKTRVNKKDLTPIMDWMDGMFVSAFERPPIFGLSAVQRALPVIAAIIDYKGE